MQETTIDDRKRVVASFDMRPAYSRQESRGIRVTTWLAVNRVHSLSELGRTLATMQRCPKRLLRASYDDDR